MKLFVRAADPVREKTTLLELLGRNLSELDHAARFEWLYSDNPAGKAWSWFICDGDGDSPIGLASVFPRFFWVDQSMERVGQVGDFAVDAAYRSLGPALRLQKATFELVDGGVLKFCYDCPPHERGMSTFRRLGLAPICRMVRFTRLVRVDAAVRERLPGGGIVHAPTIFVANALLRVRARLRRKPKSIVLETLEGRFGEEFDAFELGLRRYEHNVRARRMADELNWRYRSNPLNRYLVTTARLHGDLIGFSVSSEIKPNTRLVEMSAATDAARFALLEGLVEIARARENARVNTYVADRSRDAAGARKAGFVRREPANRIVVYDAQDYDSSAGIQSLDWAFGYADTIA